MTGECAGILLEVLLAEGAEVMEDLVASLGVLETEANPTTRVAVPQVLEEVQLREFCLEGREEKKLLLILEVITDNLVVAG